MRSRDGVPYPVSVPLAVRINPSGRLLDSFIDLNNLSFSRFHVFAFPAAGAQVPWNVVVIEDRNTQNP
jgi:hypothetical protein